MRPETAPFLMHTARRDRAQRSQAEPVTRSSWQSAAHSSGKAVAAAGNVRRGDGIVGNAAVVCQSDAGTFLYVANFSDGTVDVFDHRHRQVSSFRDPGLPRSYAPLDLQLIDANLFVTFVDRDVFCRDPFTEPGNGVIAQFNRDGVLLERAEFRSRGHAGAVWHWQMRERIAIEHVQRKRGRRASVRGQPAS